MSISVFYRSMYVIKLCVIGLSMYTTVSYICLHVCIISSCICLGYVLCLVVFYRSGLCVM